LALTVGTAELSGWERSEVRRLRREFGQAEERSREAAYERDRGRKHDPTWWAHHNEAKRWRNEMSRIRDMLRHRFGIAL
jgi:hypothetical protein